MSAAARLTLLLGWAVWIAWSLASPAIHVHALVSAIPSATPCPTPSPTSNLPWCTPPACAMDEVLYCPADCPRGCGYECATITPMPGSEGPAAVPESPSLILLGVGIAALALGMPDCQPWPICTCGTQRTRTHSQVDRGLGHRGSKLLLYIHPPEYWRGAPMMLQWEDRQSERTAGCPVSAG